MKTAIVNYINIWSFLAACAICSGSYGTRTEEKSTGGAIS